MPATFTRAPAETVRKEPGIGGKPPLDRRPTGGGGGGGDDDWNKPQHGPRERLYRFRRLIFSVLTADMIFFAVLVAIFFARQASTHLDLGVHGKIGNGHMLLRPVLYLNTLILLLGNLTVELARRNIFREFDVLEEWLGLGRPALRRTLPWLAATVACGALFLAGQATAWRQLAAQGFAFDRWTSPASYFFYIITGLHAAHVALGVLSLVLCLCTLGWLKRIEDRQIAVDAVAWYWHTVGLTWLILIVMLAASQ